MLWPCDCSLPASIARFRCPLLLPGRSKFTGSFLRELPIWHLALFDLEVLPSGCGRHCTAAAAAAAAALELRYTAARHSTGGQLLLHLQLCTNTRWKPRTKSDSQGLACS